MRKNFFLKTATLLSVSNLVFRRQRPNRTGLFFDSTIEDH